MPMQMALSLLAFTSAIGVAYAAGGIHSQMLHALGRYERGEPMECERPRSAKWWGAVSFGTLRQVAAEEPQLLGAAVRDCLGVPVPHAQGQDDVPEVRARAP